jgi:hypothetical protein
MDPAHAPTAFIKHRLLDSGWTLKIRTWRGIFIVQSGPQILRRMTETYPTEAVCRWTGSGACSDVVAPLGLRWASRRWPNQAHAHGSAGWWHLDEEGDLARLTRGVLALGEFSRWLVAGTVLPCNSGASHGASRGPRVTKRLRAAAAAPPQPPRCLQLQRNHR